MLKLYSKEKSKQEQPCSRSFLIVRTKLSQDAETIFKGKKQTRTTMLKVILNRLLVTVFGLETLLISGVVQTYWTS